MARYLSSVALGAVSLFSAASIATADDCYPGYAYGYPAYDGHYHSPVYDYAYAPAYYYSPPAYSYGSYGHSPSIGPYIGFGGHYHGGGDYWGHGYHRHYHGGGHHHHH